MELDKEKLTDINLLLCNLLSFRSLLSHEYGHCLQSVMLGPLYLVVVGLPSFVWANVIYHRIEGVKYTWFYTESWANYLGEKFTKQKGL